MHEKVKAILVEKPTGTFCRAANNYDLSATEPNSTSSYLDLTP